jgi:hypothetical protein
MGWINERKCHQLALLNVASPHLVLTQLRKAPLGAQKFLVSELRTSWEYKFTWASYEKEWEKPWCEHSWWTLRSKLIWYLSFSLWIPPCPDHHHTPTSLHLSEKLKKKQDSNSTSTSVTKHSDCQCLGFLHHWKERASHKRNPINLCKTWHRTEKFLRDE